MKVCLWGDIAGALKGKTSGGSELQTALLAKVLAKAGNEVVVIDYETPEDFVTEEGVKVFGIRNWNNGIKLLRVVTHRLPALYRALKKQDADIYYCRMRDFMHYIVFRASRKVNGKFILAMASDLDAMDLSQRVKHFYLPNIGYGSGLWLVFNGFMIELVHPWLLRNADMVFVQHHGQKEILKMKGIASTLYPNLIEADRFPEYANRKHRDFVYVGWLDKRKGFSEFFELINRSPQQTFKIIGPPRDKTGRFYYNKLKEFPNVQLLGALPHKETLRHIADSRALISTSPMEGFPNIFIEAWAYGVPVLSLYFDPGGIIRRENLGKVADGDIILLQKYMEETQYSDEFACRARSYVENNHLINTGKINQTDALFKILADKERQA